MKNNSFVFCFLYKGVILSVSVKEEYMKFCDANETHELIDALNEYTNYLKNTTSGTTNYVYHYTKEKSVIDILKNAKWRFGNPKNMNDGLEANYLKCSNIDSLFFASFLSDGEENLGMWSMYAQPWSRGIIIKIPFEILKKWRNTIVNIYDDKGAVITATKKVLHLVAYSNEKSKNKMDPYRLICGAQINNNFSSVLSNSTVAGYVKDDAWSYEKELRFRIETPVGTSCECIYMDIPKDVLDSFEFITGPRYEGNLLSVLRTKVDSGFDSNRIKPSLFTGRLKWIYCDDCKGVKEDIKT